MSIQQPAQTRRGRSQEPKEEKKQSVRETSKPRSRSPPKSAYLPGHSHSHHDHGEYKSLYSEDPQVQGECEWCSEVLEKMKVDSLAYADTDRNAHRLRLGPDKAEVAAKEQRAKEAAKARAFMAGKNKLSKSNASTLNASLAETSVAQTRKIPHARTFVLFFESDLNIIIVND